MNGRIQGKIILLKKMKSIRACSRNSLNATKSYRVEKEKHGTDLHQPSKRRTTTTGKMEKFSQSKTPAERSSFKID